ncbi:hypothetical protein ACHAW5_002940 [Stephanodiscus triporus]|uniref:S1 motif domain-containing protein n=1 Tax=Stephanodiscus triporus TaxID=2934178 RepID=A0ABD3Q2Z1_9STRA
MSSLKWKKSLLMACIMSTGSLAFHNAALRCQIRNLFCHNEIRRQQRIHTTTMTASSATEENGVTRKRGGVSPSGACYYRRMDGSWKPRKELNKLFIGERLFATRLPERDLLDGKTGPKGNAFSSTIKNFFMLLYFFNAAFLECGVGERNSKGKWSIVNGMVRLGKKGMKLSVARKRILQKLPPNMLIEVYVSKIKLDERTLEVCLNREEALEKGSIGSKIPASSLTVGGTLAGIVKNVTPYGVFVDVNANRNGLLHISKVAKHQDAYVSKEDGLKKLGLAKGSLVNVMVMSNDGKRLELDLAPTPDITEGTAAEDNLDSVDPLDSISSATSYNLMDDNAAAWVAYGADGSGIEERDDIGNDEAAMWAAYSVDSSISDIDEDEDEDYDEDTDIEDALGIGYY